MAEDRTLFVRHPPAWWLPSIAVVKSSVYNRWTAIIWLHTDNVPYVDYDTTFTWWLQLRAWWPPIWCFRGWIKWD